jgi:hypothetical protein
VETPDKLRSLGRRKRRLWYNIKLELKEVIRDVDWIEMARDRDGWQAFLNVKMNLQVP